MLTYMSMRDAINVRCADGRLVLLRPRIVGTPVERWMFLSEEVNQLLIEPWDNQEWKERCYDLRETLEEFIQGGIISIARESRRAKDAYMSQLEMPSDRVWDIRARHPSPGIRIIGSFAEKDIFVGITWGLRKCLGEYGSSNWKNIVMKFHAEWKSLFGSYLPISDEERISEENINDYISEPIILLGDRRK